MEIPITKSQLSWVMIRGLGVFMCYKALLGTINMIQTSAIFRGIGRVANSDGYGSGNAVLGSMALHVLFSAAIGIYLLFSGKTIHRLLMREPGVNLPQEPESLRSAANRKPDLSKRKTVTPWPPGSQKQEEKTDTGTTLTEREFKEFGEWLERNPTFQSRAQPDQIALFRDFQKGDQSPQ